MTAFYSKLSEISIIGLWSPIGPKIFSWTSVMCQTPAHFIAAAHFTYPSLLMEWVRHLQRHVLYSHLHKQLIEHNSAFSTKTKSACDRHYQSYKDNLCGKFYSPLQIVYQNVKWTVFILYWFEICKLDCDCR